MSIESQKFFDEAVFVKKEASEKEVELKAVVERLSQPFAEIDFSKEGLVEASSEDGKYKLTFEMVAIDEAAQEKIEAEIKHLKSKGYPDDGKAVEVKNWRRTKRMLFVIDGEEIDTAKFLPADYQILFCPEAEAVHGSIAYEWRSVFLFQNPASILNLSILMHEIGHHNFEQKKVAGKVEKLTGENLSAAEKLRDEREASLFALRRLWTIIKKQNFKEDVVLFLKSEAYNSYCTEALQQLATDRYMAHFYSGYEDEERWERQEEENNQRLELWKQFQLSEFYEDWKKGREFDEEDEWSQYNQFTNWLDKNKNNPEFYDKYFPISEQEQEESNQMPDEVNNDESPPVNNRW